MRQLIVITLSLLMLSCAALSDFANENTRIAGALAYSATVELIERSDNPGERAARILEYTDSAITIIEADESVTVTVLHQAICVLIDWDAIPPVDRPLVNDLLLAVRDKIAEKIDQGEELTPETEVSLLQIIGRIRMAAEFHA